MSNKSGKVENDKTAQLGAFFYIYTPNIVCPSLNLVSIDHVIGAGT